MKKVLFLLMLVAFVALVACAPAPTATPVPPTAAPTVAPKPTDVPKPTDAPKPTVAPTVASSSSASSVASASSASSVASSAAVTATKPAAAPTNTVVPTATPRPPAVTAAAGAIKVNFWHHLSAPEQVDMIQRFADEFNAKNPKYYIVPTFQGTTSELPKKVNAAITAGAVPDMVTGNPGDLLDYNVSGALVSLDTYLKDATNGLDAASIDEITLKLPNGQQLYFDMSPDGKTMGVSPSRSMEVMYYNVDMLKAAGFNAAPTTWDDFDKVCAAITKGDNYCLAINSPSLDTSAFAAWVFSRGGTYASNDEKKATFDEQAGIDALTWVKNGVDKGWFKNSTVTSRGDQTDFGLGKLAFTFGSTAGLPFYNDAMAARKEGPFAWSVAAIPGGPKGKPVVTFFGPSIGIMKTTADKQLGAWLFLKYILQKENQVEWAQRLVYFPASKSARDLVLTMDPAKVAANNSRLGPVYTQYKLAAGFAPMGLREPIAPAWQGVRSIISNMLTAVSTGKTSADFTATAPDAAAKEGVQRVNKSLDSYGK